MRRRPWGWGAAAVAGYAATALALGLAGQRVAPLFDGQAPPAPYRWVNPPPEFAQGNQPPEHGEQVIRPEDEVKALTAFTLDAQASITAADPAFGEETADEEVRVAVAPLDPATVGPPPEGLAFDGNAYEVSATAGGEPVELVERATVVLRYPAHATDVLRSAGSRWERLPQPIVVPESLTIYAETTELGTFVAAGPPQPGGGGNVLRWVGYGAAALALVGAVVLARVRAARATSSAKGGSKKKKKKKKK